MVAVDIVLVRAILAPRDAALIRADAGDAALVGPRVALRHDGVGADVDHVDASLFAWVLYAVVGLALHVGLASVVAALAETAGLGAELSTDVL